MTFSKGRGAGSNQTGRFEKNLVEREPLDPLEESKPSTLFFTDKSRSILTRNDSPDIPFAVSVNPYRGCEHGCVYCYARPTHEYLGLSAGLDFETKVFVKKEAPLLLRKELLSPRYRPEAITFSGVTDCYQPAERRFRLTRACLEVLTAFRNPFSIITKNQGVLQDLDLIQEMAALKAAAVFITITTLDADLCAILEPRTSRPAARLETVRRLREAGVPVGVMIAPVIPSLTDHELPKILEAAAAAGAQFAAFVPLRLPHSVSDLFSEWLGQHFPDRKEKVLNRIRSLREGKLNDPDFGSRMQGKGQFAEILRAMFRRYARLYGLNKTSLELSTEHFQRPGEQLPLF